MEESQEPGPSTDPRPGKKAEPAGRNDHAAAVAHGRDSNGDAGGELQRIGRFVVLRELGRGSMGVVYSAYDEELDRKIALKLMRVDLRGKASLGRNQLLREAQALARLAHPNVVAVHEAGVYEGAVYIAMEYVQGIDLQTWLTDKPRPWRAIVEVFRQAGEGLLAAHRRGLVHRDFKPGNVLVGDDGRVRVADFGLAAHRDAPQTGGVAGHEHAFTQSSGSYLEGTLAVEGALVGTPAYMAPEQLRGEPATPASDQFTFCVALYEAIHGVRPFNGDTLEALTRSVERDTPRSGPARPDAPRWLHALVMRGLQRDPQRRFPSMAELLAVLARDPEAERHRRRRLVALLVVAVVLTVVVVVGLTGLYALVAHNAAERRARARLASLQEQLVTLHADGRDAEAGRLLQAFAELPDNRGTTAPSAAYLGWAALLTDHAAAVDVLAAAYIAATDADAEQAALRGLVARLTARGAEVEAAAVLATLDAHAPGLAADPSLAPARVAAALYRRDLAAARDALAVLAPDDPLAAYRPVLEHMSHGTVYSLAHFGQDNTLELGLAADDLDGDGRRELLAFDDGAAGHAQLHALTRGLPRVGDPRLPPFARVFPLPHRLTGAPTVLLEGLVDAPTSPHDRDYQLLQLAPDGTQRTLVRWHDHPGTALTVADVDGDGVPALYFGSGPYARRLSRLAPGPDGAWTRTDAHPPTDGLASDYNAMTSADLDGDGHPELVVAVGPWGAYDLRVLRSRGEGLELVARRTFGSISGLVTFRAGGETLIAINKIDEYGNPVRFGPDTPLGEPAGIYVLALQGDALELRQFIADVPSDAPRRNFRTLLVGDLDGDGQDDLVARNDEHTSLLLRGPDGFRDPLVLRGLDGLIVAEVDGDPQVEILALVRGVDPYYVLLGEGGAPVAPLPNAVVAARPPPVALADPAIAAAWGRAEELAAIGLPGRSAAELAAIAGLAGPVREDMWLRAAELYAAAGDHAAAAPLFLAAAARPDLTDPALAGAARSRRQLGELVEAESLVAARLALPDLPSAARVEAEAEAARLRSATAPRPEQHLRFDAPLDLAWKIHDPLAVARAPGTGALSLRSSPTALVAELPQVWDGGPFGLTVELEVDYLEWGTAMTIGLRRPEQAEAWFGAQVKCSGGMEDPSVAMGVVERSGAFTQQHYQDVDGARGRRMRASVMVHPELEVVILGLEVDGMPTRRSVVPFHSDATPGPLDLALFGATTNLDQVGHVRITAIDLVGLRPVAPARGSERAREVVREIAENELDAALDALGEPATGTPQALWRADLLARLGRPGAAAALRHALGPSLLDSPLFGLLFQRLRRPRDDFSAVARAALGRDYAGMRYSQFAIGVDPRADLVEDALADLADLPAAPPAGASLQAVTGHIELLQARARAWQIAGRGDLARRDLESIESILGPSPRHELSLLRIQTTQALLDIVAGQGDLEATRRLARTYLEIRADPNVSLEMLRVRPTLRERLSAADWAELESTARQLAADAPR